ncbi:MAG: anti-sigma factor [Planctomycetes bacterium]|nr:anti-sigma factor [Planctomycetota bacterium]
MSARRFDQDRFEELRAARALGGLTAAECAEFTALLAEHAGIDLEADELAVAAVELTSVEQRLAPLPVALAKKLEADAQAHFAAKPGAASAPSAPRSQKPSTAKPAAAPIPKLSSVPERRLRVMPSLVAVAAGLLIALAGWWPRLMSSSPSPEAEREALLAQAGVLRVPWSGTDFAKGAEGDVVWDPNAQRGFMRIRGLAANDPTREQYQLWIFDETQKHPVDGGVFDVGADGELIVPIDAKLFVANPTLFAVTVEKPGGVVVSAQEKIVLAGKV